MEKIILKAKPRSVVGKKVKHIRKSGELPAVLYGHKFNNQILSINAHDFGRIYESAGHNTIIDLKVEGDKPATYNVLIHQVHADNVSDLPIHADLYRVKMDEEIRTTVPLHFSGESVAVFQEGGSLLTNIEEVEIETMPANLPASIEVDIAVLDDFEKTITVAELNIPPGVKVLNDPEELIAKVDPPRTDAELAELEEPVGDEIPEEQKEESDQEQTETTEETEEES